MFWLLLVFLCFTDSNGRNLKSKQSSISSRAANSDPSPAQTTLKILTVTWNQENQWQSRIKKDLKRVLPAKLVTKLQPDVIFFCEQEARRGNNKMAKYAKDYLKPWFYQPNSRDPRNDYNGEQNGFTRYTKNGIKLSLLFAEKHKTGNKLNGLWTGRAQTTESQTFFDWEGKGGVVVHLGYAGREVALVCSHLNSKDPVKSKDDKDKLLELVGETSDVIFTGDLNQRIAVQEKESVYNILYKLIDPAKLKTLIERDTTHKFMEPDDFKCNRFEDMTHPPGPTYKRKIDSKACYHYDTDILAGRTVFDPSMARKCFFPHLKEDGTDENPWVKAYDPPKLKKTFVDPPVLKNIGWLDHICLKGSALAFAEDIPGKEGESIISSDHYPVLQMVQVTVGKLSERGSGGRGSGTGGRAYSR